MILKIFFSLFTLIIFNANAQIKCSENSNLVILIDLSSPLDQPSEIAYATLSKKLIDSAPSGGRLSVYAIKLNSEEVGKKADFEICVPDYEKMKGEKYRNRAKDKFKQQVEPELIKLGKVYIPANKSPILENIFKISHAVFLRSATNDGQTLLILSDFIQFSEIANFYKEVPSYSKISLNKDFSAWMPKVKSIKLKMVALNSDDSKKVDLHKIREFWLEYSKTNFKQCGYSGINQAAVSFENDC
jgi:hypothetical protein